MEIGQDRGKEVTIVGGVRAGILNATWPFARMTVSQRRLRLKWMGRELSFHPDQVVGFKRRRNGCQIYHVDDGAPAPLVFWGNADRIFEAIQSVGFAPAAKGPPDAYDDAALLSQNIVGVGMLVLFLALAVFAMVCGR